MTTHWLRDVPVTGEVELPPDPRAFDALGRNHAFETAIADLVDNSIDAEADHVLVRLVRDEGRLVGLYVVDNGEGMDEPALDSAMRIGGGQRYGATGLGRFGLGLKAASFSQARELTVVSRASGCLPAGRRWRLAKACESFLCDEVAMGFAERELAREWPIPDKGSGTVVRWDDVTAFPTVSDTETVESYLDSTMNRTRLHLGLVLHRLIQSGRIEVFLDVEEADAGRCGPTFRVDPVDPFGYRSTGHSAYPVTLNASHEGERFEMRCHIWPARSSLPEFRLPGGAVAHQGFYFYRHDRLLQAGGWNRVRHPAREWQLGRVAVDIDGDLPGLFSMNPEKSKLEAGPNFASLVLAARGPNEESFDTFLAEAEATYRRSRRRSRDRPKAIPPGRGFEPYLRDAIADELDFLEGEEAIEVRWAHFDNYLFFDIDRERRVLWLNLRYRRAVLGGRRGRLNDAPVVKALLYLLVEDLFRGQYLGARDKDNLEMWQQTLTAAALCEDS